MNTKALRGQYTIALGLLAVSATSVFLLVCRIISHDSLRYTFMVWNLFLAWIPLVCAWSLRRWLRHNSWGTWQAVVLTLVCLSFLPNSFYMISDFVHLGLATGGGLLDLVMFMSFAFAGIMLGFATLYALQIELRRRLPGDRTWAIVFLIIMASSFAIYLGRFLKWNSWDIILNPGGLLFDVSDSIVGSTYSQATISTTLMFFILLSGIYFCLVQMVEGFKRLPD